ncbi:PREDICTED: linoleate 13S-lipoxygenase 2-1, chloroplastic-like [Nelumbo nucifera]|uniref:Lipoxygenase n=2 Tax=Nelumbo nucifera TaxID=4432 RepID=A0A1U8AS27_NELNU|nr:PREDICTED: linoleate 13S-lipoxygenase 2-1, chloroplastic-like [Nelumbo nucifera]DAD29951.1 TPA_asm: hypothetical protein HUJ06_031419 [Nelumbo nucifera]
MTTIYPPKLQPKMLNAHQTNHSARSLFLLQNSFMAAGKLPIRAVPIRRQRRKSCSVCSFSSDIRAVKITKEKVVTVNAVVNVKLTGLLSNLGLGKVEDTINDVQGEKLLLELVSAELDPKTGLEKKTVRGHVDWVSQDGEDAKYQGKFDVPTSFGDVGAVLVQNEFGKEIFLKDVVLGGISQAPVHIVCNSWVHSKSDNPEKRIFFINKSYLPSQTPSGLKTLRQKELESLRGNGKGERKTFDRIYDYDTYNDLGDPDSNDDLARPVLGGKKHPYPRRCRTGREKTKKDPLSEKRSSNMYVPRDEAFSQVKQQEFTSVTVSSALNGLLPLIRGALVDTNLGFPTFKAIGELFDKGVPIPLHENQGLLETVVSKVTDIKDDLLRFDTPELVERDNFSWSRDEEFARQTLAGINPCSIQLVTEWPLKSELDPKIYGPPESAITTELVEREIKGIMTIDEALQQKKLFMLDYHDLLLPYVNKVRELEGTTLYGSRTLFFLTHENILTPIAIELTRPPTNDKPLWKQVFTPNGDATDSWLWRLAKVHVLAHDSGYHELVSHWLRTHCCMEPYIIASNRQLSAMHPIYKLLHPHFRYTMRINALARTALINASGIIEDSFSPAKYSMELSSVVYDKFWQFDKQGLPADLISRGMAIEDPTAKHGLKLTIEDYPFASDGLLLWTAIKQWVSDYVNHYYQDPNLIESDQELQAWWTEVRTKGHEDKKDEPWWPVLRTQDDLIEILTTIIWVASAHHAAVNFGQYAYGGYFPNRPTIARTNMPTEDPTEQELQQLLKKPELSLMHCYPSQLQAALVMAVLIVLSTHSSDEEYLGTQNEPSWTEDPVVKKAYEQFNKNLKEVEGIIDARNKDLKLKNRTGAGVVPYQLLKPFSKEGLTGMGVPNSTSI